MDKLLREELWLDLSVSTEMALESFDSKKIVDTPTVQLELLWRVKLGGNISTAMDDPTIMACFTELHSPTDGWTRSIDSMVDFSSASKVASDLRTDSNAYRLIGFAKELHEKRLSCMSDASVLTWADMTLARFPTNERALLREAIERQLRAENRQRK